MTKFATDKHAFPHAKLTRSAEGILEVVLHTDADTLVFNGRTDQEFCREGKKVFANLLDIAVPVIAALNDPMTVQSEYVLLCDIVIAAPDTAFQDEPHFCFGMVLTQHEGRAEEAKALGAVNEIVDRERLLRRSREIAAGMAKLPPLTASYTRVALTQPLCRLVDENVGYGPALEGISAADIADAGAAR